MAVAGTGPLLARLVSFDRWRVRPPIARASLAASALVLIVWLTALGGLSAGRQAWDNFRRPDPVITSADPAARLGSLSGQRYRLWSSSLDAFKAHPLGGTGPGTFEFWWSRTAPVKSFERDAHSLFMETLAELGAAGLAVLLMVIGALFWTTLGRRRDRHSAAERGVIAALVAAFTVYLFQSGIDWLWESTAVSVLGLALIAVAGSGRIREGSILRVPRVGLAIAALICCAVQLPGLASTSDIRTSQRAAAAGLLPQAEAVATDAIAAQPWASSPYMQRGLVREQAGALDPAAADLREATAREQTNWRPWLLLARVEAERGHLRAALRAYREVRSLRPFSDFARR
jgi:hypothetical protein